MKTDGVKLYSTGCPRCKVVEKLLAKKEIDYEVIDDVDAMQRLNILSVPVLYNGIDMLQFSDAVKWISGYTAVD